jgi:hypothetical protein
MRKSYRITKRRVDFSNHCYVVQVRSLLGWTDVKTFYDPHDPQFAQLEATELLEKLEEL